MANNRMYLVNSRTGARVLIAKFFPSGGWGCWASIEEIQKAFTDADFSEEEQSKNAEAIRNAKNPFAGPYKAKSSDVNGEVWKLEYE